MNRPRSQLPLTPLVRAYDRTAPSADDLTNWPIFGPRIRAITAARSGLIAEQFLETASESAFLVALAGFYDAVVQPPLHGDSLAHRAGMVRFALAHLRRCPEPLPLKIGRVLASDGAYHVAGLGPAFWSAVLQALDPDRQPAWLPTVATGLRRLGLIAEVSHAPESYADWADAYARIRLERPEWTTFQIDHFLMCVASMSGRELIVSAEPPDSASDAPRLKAVRDEERRQTPLRRRLRERGKIVDDARAQLEAGLHDGHAGKILAALTAANPSVEWPRSPHQDSFDDALTIWVGRLWEADDPFEILTKYWHEAPFPAFGLGLPAAVLHLRNPAEFPPWNEPARQGYALLDDAFDASAPPAENYRLFTEGAKRLRELYQIHPYELSAVLGGLALPDDDGRADDFSGFCADSFHFLHELSANNHRTWMDRERDRYQFAVREPMTELCSALAARYVRPVLGDLHGWRLATEPKTTHCLSSICKNNYGRSSPYETALWFAFYRPECGSKRDDAQLFVRLEPTHLSFGLYIGHNAKSASERFRQNVLTHADELFSALAERGAFAHCNFAHSLQIRNPKSEIRNSDDLRRWANGKALTMFGHLPPDSPLSRTDEVVGEILLAFDRLIPAYACAVEADPVPWLRRRGEKPPPPPFTDRDFERSTHLNPDWLGRARTLLDLKRQLILQGVPGTGKTHVARSLARLLTGGRDETIRLVQFHPAYSYEEFVEGIRAKTVESNGRHDVTYPVEDGLLCRFAAEAARRPAEPHVLLIDEINRGNLPRIFGELLYLLEYRNQTVGLPYSRRDFHLPPNLYLIGTMNAADRSVALIDQALRRRFSFLDMPPDPAVLAGWLRDHPPRDGEEFAQTVVALFEGLNLRLRNDLGAQVQVGHSYFMVPDLDEERLRAVWDHHVWPLLSEHFAANLDRLANYQLDRVLNGKKKREKASSSALHVLTEPPA